MAFAIGAAFANTLCSAKSKKPDEDAALERGESSTFAQPSPFGRASIVPPLDFSSLGTDENQFDVEASPYHDPGAVDRSAPSTSAASLGHLKASSRAVTKLRSLSRRSLRRNVFASPPEQRVDQDLQVADEFFFNTTAAAHLTRPARVLLGRFAQLELFDPGDVLCHANTPMHCVYFIVSGQILYEPHTADGQPCPDQAVLLDPQTSLGTFAPAPKHIHTDARGQPRSRQMAGGNDIVTPRTRVWPGGGPGHVWGGTARAATPCEVAVVTQEQWLQLVQDEPRWDARQLALFLEDLPLFSQLTRTQLLELSRVLRFKQIPAGSLVYRQGSEGDDVYVIRRGYVRLLREVQMPRTIRENVNIMTDTMERLRYDLDVLTTPRAAKSKTPFLRSAPVTPRSPRTSRTSFDPNSPRLPAHLAVPHSSTRIPNPTTSPQHAHPHKGRISSTVPSPRRSSKPSVPHLDLARVRGSNGSVFNAPKDAPQPFASPFAAAPASTRSTDTSQVRARFALADMLEEDEEDTHDTSVVPASPRKASFSQIGSPRDGGGGGGGGLKSTLSKRGSSISRHAMEQLNALSMGISDDEGDSGEGEGEGRGGGGGGGDVRSSGATERLLQTLKSRKSNCPLFIDPSIAHPDTTSQQDTTTTTNSTSLQKGYGGKSALHLGTYGRLPASSQRAFISASPRRVEAQEGVLFVEMGLLASGRVFGEGRRGDKSRQRFVSAVADTNVELLTFDKAELTEKLGDLVHFLWNQEPMEGKPLVTDQAFRGQLSNTLKWEVFKKKQLHEVFELKRARLDGIMR